MRRLSRALRPPTASESGETLIEVMVTVLILGTSMVAILGALWVTTRTGDFNQKSSQADLVLRDYAETLKAKGPTTIGSTAYDATYIPCQTLGTTGTYPAFVPPAPNATYQATITKIEFLDGYTGTAPKWKAQSAGCPSGGDQGLQRLTLRVNGPPAETGAKASESTTIVKRDTTGEL
jgi:type II secretory pathway pseudopilin PulG